jgi:hypothetical protein
MTTGQPTQAPKQWLGVYLGTVVQTRPQDAYVQVQVPQLSGFAVHTWAPPMGTISSAPAIGETVLVMFIAGDLNYPVYNVTGTQPFVAAPVAASTALSSSLSELLEGSWVNVVPPSGWTTRTSYTPFRVLRAGNLLLVQGAIVTASTIANGTTIAAFGSGYYNPKYFQVLPVIQQSGSAVFGGGPFLVVNTSGAVVIEGITTAGTLGIDFNGFIYLT